MPQFLDFDDGVIVSKRVEDFWNGPQSDQEIFFLAKKFNLTIRDEFFVQTKEIRRNCPDCMGCHNSICTLGCFDSDTNVVCLWDKALKEIIGTKLILHEYGHVIYEQIFETNLSEDEAFEQSEEFAQYVEDNYTIALSFCEGCSENQIQARIQRMHLGDMMDHAIEGIIAGFALAAGGAAFAILASRFLTKEKFAIAI